MRPYFSFLLLFILSIASFAQSWSNVLSPSRAMNWAQTGLQAIFPDGETTTNPWTPPTRTLCTTLNPVGGGSDDGAQIVTAVAGCANGTYVLLAAGTWTVSTFVRLSPGYTSGHNNVTVRGSGPMSTIITMSGSVSFQLGAGQAAGSALLTNAGANYTVGNTSVVITTASPPSVGMLAYFNQCDTGSTWNGTSCVGSPVDNNGLFVCSFDPVCQTSSGLTPHYNDQNEYVIITSVTNSGGGTYTIGFTPGLRMPNWSFAQAAQLNWLSSTYTAIGMGLENLTIVFGNLANQAVVLNGCYDCWMKGVRLIGAGVSQSISLGSTSNCLVSNNYIFGQNSALSSAIHFDITQGQDSSDLILNNILTGGSPLEGEGFDTGDVLAYNFNRDAQTTYYQLEIQHHGESSLLLHEGNQQDGVQDDDTWGTHHFNTWFRNYYSGWDVPYVAATNNPRALQIDDFARFENVIGNAFGGTQTTTGYSSTGASGYIYALAGSDTLARTSLLRWGNYDTFTSAVRWCGNSSSPGWSTTCGSSSEIPTTLAGNASAFNNIIPSNTNLPCSFFLAGYTSTNCAAHSNGGTGLNWWKVCTSWTTFPTNCATYTTPPFPPIGPDVSGGSYVGGFAYDIPAALAHNNLPIDSTYQLSYSISSFSWSGGVETLTFSGGVLPNVTHLMGGFQISGATGACNSSAGAEFLMTGSTATTVTYAIANPGACSGGSMKFPDVRKFDERVFANDPLQFVGMGLGIQVGIGSGISLK